MGKHVTRLCGRVNPHYNNEWGDIMYFKVYKKGNKPCDSCIVIKRNGVVELHLYSSVRRFANAQLHYLESGYAVYCYHVFSTGSLWYISACTMSQPFDMSLTRLTGVVVLSKKGV